MGRIRVTALGCCILLQACTAPESGADVASGIAADGAGGFEPVTRAMLENPDASDWLMYSRTYDAQRYSPLDAINQDNVAGLARAWTKPLPAGVIEIIPIVYDGVMYLSVPAGDGEGGGVIAVDATDGETLWHYQPEEPMSSRIKSIAIYDDMIYFSASAGGDAAEPVIALDAETGAVRWQTPVTPENHTAGTIVVDGKVISGRTCNSRRENCYIAAHDAETGDEVWRFYTAPGEGEPGDESWGGTPASERRASTWGLPGTYDPELNLVFWGISNPMPNGSSGFGRTRSSIMGRWRSVTAVPKSASSSAIDP